MKASLYNHVKTDFINEKIFFGSNKNTQRFDVMKYSWYDKINNTMQGKDWAWDEVTIDSDINDHENKLDDTQRFIIKLGLQRAIFLDSLNGRSPILMFGQVTNLPEVEAAITTWTHFEVNKHSRTYTKHLRAFYKDPAKVFDESFNIPELSKNTKKISAIYDECYYEINNWIYKSQRDIPLTEHEKNKLYEKFIMAWVEVNILEGIRFYPFFTTIWAMHNGEKLMEELSSDLIFIARDENEHLKITQYTLNLLKKKKEEGFTEVFKKLSNSIKERYYEAYEEESEWIDFLFSKGSYLGMNASICKSYVNYRIVKALNALGYEADVNRLGGVLVKNNPIPWSNWYINNDKEEKLPQQSYILNYIVNALNHDVSDHTKLDAVIKYIKIGRE